MLIQYIQAALGKAKYETIEDEELYYGEVSELEGVWATGKTFEECTETWKKLLTNGSFSDWEMDCQYPELEIT
jgi:hypothetical protein